MNYADAELAIMNRKPFKKSQQLSGRIFSSGEHFDSGRLGNDKDRFLEAIRDRRVSYIVYSYATPIAWYDDEYGWFVTDEYFSHVTSRAQNIVRRISSSH